ncbi:MAG: hypothetical protein KIT72_10335 [Polyangiaceae bacterium]|nr:hypothetical protein [Polyangiaceae bacterium]MCW5790809.1 hypothetical protein [Polyangiaceae bacterium]
MMRRKVSSSLVALACVAGMGGATPRAQAQPTAPAGSAAPSGSAAPAGSAAPTGSAAPASSAAPAPAIRRSVAPPADPTPAQVQGLRQLQSELKEYEKGAKSYRKALTMIVRHHYEERRRRVLSTLDREIDIEQKNLVAARDEAIKRLEEFIARYSGENAHPVATPDAMFRLAALYEERARVDFDADLTDGLVPAISLYRRIIHEYPGYEELAAVYYYLAHALTDANRLEEGQQAFRALVCSNRYQIKDHPDDASKLLVEPLVQDHDDAFWNEWYNKNPIPLDQDVRRRANIAKAPVDEELLFRDPYPDSCRGLPQVLEPGQEPRYEAEVWWQLGNHHFDQIDPKGGPYNLNRAVRAYEHSMKVEKPPLYGVALYKRAWTYFKQQRYQTAVEWFIKLLHYADEQEAKTGDPGADFRTEAYTYIAGSLTYVDMQGPPPEHPLIPRSDVLDLETDPLVAEQKMAIAITRVQDPALIPQDKKWTVEIYKSLAQEFIEITQNRNAIATLELTLQKFPMDRDAPLMQNRVAELYDQLSKLAPDGSSAREEYASKALAARTKLAAYVGTTPWTNANRDDPEALQQAEQLVRNGLKRAAADHTNNGRALYDRARELSDAGEQVRLLEKAVAEYRLAEVGWAAYLEQEPNALDSYESRFWLADARYQVVRLQVVMERSPTVAEVNAAKEALVAVRDSNEDDKYLQPSAYYLVDLSQLVLTDLYRRHEASGGTDGIPKVEEVEFTGEGTSRKVVQKVVPAAVLDAVKAREDYNARIPLARDPEKNGHLYAFQAGDYFFVYGQFAEARKRFTPLYTEYCGKNEWGYKAWEKLISMANFEGDAQEARRLVEGPSCAYNPESKAAEDNIRKPVQSGLAYQDAAKLFEEAEKMPDGPERAKKWRAAAAAYKAALDAAPARDEAPEAAMNGAYAYKQVGEYDKAIEMYELFIARYGSEEKLQELKNGNPRKSPPVPAEPAKYEERVGYLKQAYDALAGSYVLFFDYPKAAETFDTISNVEHFTPEDRRGAARQALSLYSSLGDEGGMARSKARFQKLGASPKELAEADFIIASSEVKKWDELSPDEGGNLAARRKAQAAMEGYYQRYEKQDAAAQYVVEAAYNVARMKRASAQRDTQKWWQNTIAAFTKWNRLAPRKDNVSTALGSREADMAAEADYVQIDADLKKSFDYDTGHHRYKGTVTEVITKYRADAVEGKKWHDRLQKVIDTYVSPTWTIVARARQGSVYDSLRTGLYNTRPPELKMFSAAQEKALKQAEESDNPELQEKADEIRVKIQQAWRDTRDKEINSADEIAVVRYSEAVVLSRRYNISKPEVVRAIRRLAFLTDVVGEAKMKTYTTRVKDLNYTEGMFVRIRPGVVGEPAADGMPRPLPVAN